MRLTLITGQVGSGKTGRIIDRLGRIVVPTESVAREMRQRILTATGRPLVGDVVMTWPHFVKSIAHTTAQALTGQSVALVLMPLLRSHSLRYFRANTISWGIARSFAHTILSLKHNLIDPKTLRAELETRGSLKENDLLTVYERYEVERKQRGLIDEGDVTLMAYERLISGDVSQLEDCPTIAFDEWYHVSPGMRAIISALKQLNTDGEIIFSLPTCDESQPFAASWQRAVAAFERIADDHIKLSDRVQKQPKIKSCVLRSPFAEARYMAKELAAKSVSPSPLPLSRQGRGKEETSVILRAGDDNLDMLLAQCARYGLLDSEAVLSRPMDAPLIHRLLAPDALANLPETATIHEFTRATVDRARESSAAKIDADTIRSAPDRPTTGRTARALFMLSERAQALATRADALMNEPISRSAFVEIMREQLNESPSLSAANALLPFSIGAFEHPPISRIATAYVPHMVEGHLPQASATHLFFGDMEEWGEVQADSILDEIFISPEEQLAYEAGLFHALIAKCEQEVICTLPLTDSGGSETAPSSFLDAFGEPTHVEVAPDCDALTITKEVQRKVDRAIAIEFERARGECATPQYHGVIAEASLREMLKQRFTETRFSPTSLERFATCPFQFFVQKVLNLEPEEEVSPEILPKDRGTIVHAVLEKFYRHHIDAFRSALNMQPKSAYEKLEGIVDAIVDEVFRESASLISYASPSLEDYQRRGVTTMAWQVIKMELNRARDLPDPLFPTQCEWVFGRTGDAPLELPVDGDKPALIKGIVDRIDANADESRFAIADYKTGRSITSVRAKILKGEHLQLPLYVLAAKALLYPDATALGGVLIGVQMSEKDHGFLRKEFNDINYSLRPRLATLMEDDLWDEALDAAREHVVRFVTEIRAGRFPTEPTQCNDNCDFKDVCRYHERAH